MTIPARLDELLSAYERHERDGTPITPEDLCRDCPDLLPDLRWHVAALRKLPPTSPYSDTAADPTDLPARVSARAEFEVLRPYARGGLGEVFVARDEALGREVAVKRIRPPLDADPARQSRFLREAVVTGRLEHPGIVPVYAVGEDESGRPCYAMRFVRGQTLREAITQFHAEDGGAVAFRDLLGRFVVVCQATAYAHERGVVHRDIKPGNVVIGPFGEAILLDWGLAQVGPAAPPGGESDQASVATAQGLVLGTPGYMAPEQAAGGRVGPAADVFGLGPTLYTLLTDRSPLEQVPPPVAGRAAPPPGLLAVARKAMATAPADRYPSALALADDLNRWLADEPVSAYRDPAFDRLARWGRRNRPLVRAGAVTLVVCVVVLAVAAVFLKRAGDRERDATALAVARKEEADESYRKARRAVDELFVAVSEGRLKAVPGAQPFRKDLLRTALKYYQAFLADRADDPANRADIAATYTKVAMVVGEVETAEAAVGWHEQAVAAWRALAAESPDRAEYRKGLAGALDLSGIHAARMGRLPEALRAQEEAIGLLDGLLAADPEDWDHSTYLSRALVNLAATQGRLGRSEAAVRTGERGVALDEALIRRRPNDVVIRRNAVSKRMNLGLDLADLGRTGEAIRALERSYQLADELCRDLDVHPEWNPGGDAISNPRGGLAQAELNLGLVLVTDEQHGEARRRLLAAAGKSRAVAAENPAVRLYREVQLAAEVGAVFVGLQSGVPAAELLAGADAACQTGTALAADDRTNPTYRARLGEAHAVRGAVLGRLGKGREAREAWDAAAGCFPSDRGNNLVLRQIWANAEFGRALGLLALGDAPAAARAGQAFLDGSEPHPVTTAAAARVLAGCAKLVDGDERRRYEDRSLELLRTAVGSGYRHADKLATDPAFDQLRDRPEFPRPPAVK